MKKSDLFIGFFIGIIGALVGAYLFLLLFTNLHTIHDLLSIKQEGYLGKVITLGAVLNIFLFFILLQRKKEFMARGIVMATIVLAIITLFL